MKRVNKWLFYFGVSLAVTLFLVTGCASKPEPVEAPPEPPDWVLTPPRADDTYEYFVGFSSDNSGDLAQAEEQATYALIADITRFLGVRITSETSAEARASLDEFEASVTQQVRQTGSAQVSGFRIVDKFVDRGENKVTVYILGRYERAALLKEKARLDAVFEEKIEAVVGPEQEAEELEDRGDHFGAIKKYIEAAVAASASDIENADIKFERNINSAKNVVSGINLFPLNDNLETFVGVPFPEDFRLKVVYGDSVDAAGLGGVDIAISYKELRDNGRLRIITENRPTNEDGYLSFTHPVPDFVGEERITMALDLYSFLEPLEDVDKSFRKYVQGLEELIARKRVTYSYVTISRAKEIPTGIVILDTDMAGNPIGDSNTASGILESLSAADFMVRVLSMDPVSLKEMNDSDVLAMLGANFSSQVERVVFGAIGIEDFEETGDGYIVKVSGTIKAADINDGRILYTKRMFSRSRGSSSSGAISAAFRNLGIKMGTELANNLP